ncbi:MAG: thiamine phosphate synthase [Dehalococcoidia bacterium]
MLRLIDANLNRMSEGLRTLEDVARFLLDDATLTAKLKSLRHGLAVEDASLKRNLLSARDSADDVGAFAEADSEAQRQDLPSIVTANARRVEESLRVLEEFAKLPEIMLESARFKQARFALYEIERELTAKILRRQKRIAGLYVIIDTEALRGRDQVEVAQQAISGGAKAIQLRDKNRNKGEILSKARELKALCVQSDVLFIVNDYLDIAIASDADGLHLGQEDLPVSTARQLIPIDRIIGCSTKTIAAALQAQTDGADYVAVGSMYPTASKTDTHVVGLETLHQIREAISIPIVAIGGIDAKNAGEVMAAGADSVAVISAVLGAEDVEEATRQLAQSMEVN